MRGNAKFKFLPAILIFSLVAASVFTVFPGGIAHIAQPPTADVAVIPDRVEDIFPSDEFTIDLTVVGAYDTQSWEANVTFDPAVLEVVGSAEGEFLKRKKIPTDFLYDIRANRILLSAAYLMIGPPGSGVTGDGQLANITFQVKAKGATPIHLDEEVTTLSYSDGSIPPKLQPCILHDGYFTNLHDIAISSVTVSPTQVILGDPVSINVTIVNQGNFTDTFDLAAFQSLIPFPDLTTIDSRTGISLGAGAETSLTFTWETTGERSGVYNITAEVPPLLEEADIADNKRVSDDTVTILGAPVAFFTHTPEKPTPIDTIIFDASKSYDPDDLATGIFSHMWDFGDGSSEFYMKDVNLTDTVIHNYIAIGNYDVNVTVTDIENLTDIYSRTLTVSAPEPPIATFNCTTEEPLINRPVAFDASESYDPDGAIVSYEWDFGDGSDPEFYEAPSGVIVTHNFTDAGTYTVNLTVTDNHDASVSTTQNVTVLTKRDIFVVKVTCYRPNVLIEPRKWAYVGETLNISVPVGNEGTQSETFNLTVHYDGPSIGMLTHEVVNLPPGDQAPHNKKKVGIFWDTTPISAGNYTITVEAVLDEDQNPTDNNATTKIEMRVPPDVAVTDVIVSPTTVLAGDLLNITVFVKNEGAYYVECAVFVYFSNDTHSNISPTGSTELSDTAVHLDPGEEEALYFKNWNLTESQLSGSASIFPGTYTLSAEAKLGAEAKPYELDLEDNSLPYGDVTIGASLISIYAPKTTVTVGSTTTLNGSIIPTRHNASVTIWHKLAEEETWDILEALTTDENSTYIYDWRPEDTGTYQLKATWLGDNMALPDESDVLEITVRQAQPALELYIAAGIAIIVVAAVAIYFLKIRKQTQ